MSWQRILRFAKVRQVPVIITDETGDDPMILLSLDQLEQALDGNAGPDIPPPVPAPRSTTPAFAPEEAVSEAAAVPSEQVIEEPTALMDERVVTGAEHTNTVELINVMVPPTIAQEEPRTERPPEPEIMTPIAPIPIPAPIEESPKPPQAPTSEMSLEERFFLEY